MGSPGYWSWKALGTLAMAVVSEHLNRLCVHWWRGHSGHSGHCGHPQLWTKSFSALPFLHRTLKQRQVEGSVQNRDGKPANLGVHQCQTICFL